VDAACIDEDPRYTIKALTRTRSCVAIALALAALSTFGRSVGLAQTPAVRTLAGSGTSGNLDGPLHEARFGAPAAIAVEQGGALVVADESLNTIREIDATRVRTIAGSAPNGIALWARGDYRDGPAPQALFNHPRGLAILPDGSIAIADTNNLCIRRLHAGVVTTIAGRPDAFGAHDGAAADATFKFPVALAVDERGDLFIADFQNGVRELSAGGDVSTLDLGADSRVTGVAYAKTARGGVLFVADVAGLIRYDLSSKTATRFSSAQGIGATDALQGGGSFGYPQAVAAYDGNVAAFSDVRNETIALLNHSAVAVIAGAAAHDTGNSAGGLRDGAPEIARFFDPKGIAILRDGSLVVADTGNHLIRTIPAPDRRYYLTPDDAGAIAPSPGRYAIAMIGNSLSWTDSTWSDSIAGRLETALSSERRSYQLFPVVLPGASLAALTSVAGEELADGRVHAIILQLNTSFFDDYGKRTARDLLADRAWATAATTQLVALREKLAADHERLIVTLTPYGTEVSPTESERWQTIVPDDSEPRMEEFAALHDVETGLVRVANVPFIDLWPDYARAATTAGAPLFGTEDRHMTGAGRALSAKSLLERLPSVDPIDFPSQPGKRAAGLNSDGASVAAKVR
jgi:DNA-binding beta-propeller fold protein YncE